ncbi:MAG: hypothetical protein V4436_01805, partial [Patescibacteria group bacterium]
VYPGEFKAVPKAPVKEKTVGKKASSTSLSKTSKSTKNTTQKSAAISPDDSPALSASLASALPSIPDFLLWVLGLMAVILLGMAGVLFLLSRSSETSLSAEEFTIE